jgi:hypothetical protein
MEPHEAAKRPQDEANGAAIENPNASSNEPATKRVKLDSTSTVSPGAVETASNSRSKGVAPIKQE